MEDEKGQQEEKRLDILADIRKTESPGRKNGAFLYAKAIYGYYVEIQELSDEGFTLATICSYFQKKGILPDEADVHSFRRAFRREVARRKKATKTKEARKKNITEKKELTQKTPAAPNVVPKADTEVRPIASAKCTQCLKVNPDNTFEIRPVDPDDLPDIENIR